MRAAVVFIILAATPGPALADELQRPPAESKPAPSSGWGWAGAVESASKVWARAPSRGDLSTAIANGGSVAVDAGSRAATRAWEHAPSRADAADFATAQGTKILASGKDAAAGVASFARSGATYTMGRWEALPNHHRLEDIALTGAIILPAIAGSFYLCTTASAPAAGPAAPAVGVGCAFVGQRVGESVARSTFSALGRPVDDETLKVTSDASLVVGTLAAGKLIANPKAFAATLRELRPVEPKLQGFSGVFASSATVVSASPALAADQPGQPQAVLAIPDNHEASAPSPTDLDKP